MPGRDEPFITKYYYHIFNKSIEGKQIFRFKSSCDYFLNLLKYYRSSKAKISFSKLKKLSDTLKEDFFLSVNDKKFFQIDIISYCLMPHHFHLLVRQRRDEGVRKFMSDVLNAFTRYFNILHERKGPIFLPRFRSVRIITDEQLVHVSRYIHLNPYSSSLIKNFKELDYYQYSSYQEYLGLRDKSICDTRLIMDHFGNKKYKYREFIEGNAEHQKTLEYVKHLNKW